MSLLAGASSYGLFGWGATEKMTNGVNTPYAVYNSFVNKLFKVCLLYTSMPVIFGFMQLHWGSSNRDAL